MASTGTDRLSGSKTAQKLRDRAIGLISGLGSLASGGVLAMTLAWLEPQRDMLHSAVESALLVFVGFVLMTGVVRLPEFGKGRVTVKGCSTLATTMQVGVFGLLVVPEIFEEAGTFALSAGAVVATGLAILTAWTFGLMASGVLYGRIRASLKR